jgi:hypothetical protein
MVSQRRRLNRVVSETIWPWLRGWNGRVETQRWRETFCAPFIELQAEHEAPWPGSGKPLETPWGEAGRVPR